MWTPDEVIVPSGAAVAGRAIPKTRSASNNRESGRSIGLLLTGSDFYI
jgi:hypothetical protein